VGALPGHLPFLLRLEVGDGGLARGVSHLHHEVASGKLGDLKKLLLVLLLDEGGLQVLGKLGLVHINFQILLDSNR